MRTVKWNPFLSGLCVLLGGVLLWTGSARADVSSTNPAAILVFPKLVVDTTGAVAPNTDTVVQITNTSAAPVNVRCFLVDANGHCSDDGDICDPAAAPGTSANPCDPAVAYCKPGWNETDFAFQLSPGEPIGWLVGQGFADVPFGGSIVPAPEDPMKGELKCVEVDANGAPVDSNDLKGEATIETYGGSGQQEFDTRGYNAIGIQAIAGANNGDDTLVLGQEYNGCPNLLVLDSFFDDAIDPAIPGYRVRTKLTLVPCSEDFEFQAPLTTVVQYLVYNEFEQRFSTSRSMTCFSEQDLSDIDTRPGLSDDSTSIWNVNVEGTLTGQTIIRGVADGSTTHGNGLLGVAEEFHGLEVAPPLMFAPFSSDAFSLVQRGVRTQNDIITMPPAGAPGP